MAQYRSSKRGIIGLLLINAGILLIGNSLLDVVERQR